MVTARCEDCPLAGTPLVPATIRRRSWVVVGEAPGQHEVEHHKPFVGESGQILRACLKSRGVDPSKVAYTNACMCRPPGNKTPKPQAIIACQQRLIDELRAMQPLGIIAVGGTALAAVTPTDETQPYWATIKRTGKNVARFAKAPPKITHRRGLVWYDKRFHCNVVSTFHPSACLRSVGLFKRMSFDIAKLLSYDIDSPATHPRRPSYTVCDTVKQWRDQLARIRPGWVSIDVETTSKYPERGRLLAIGVGHSRGVAIAPNRIVEAAGTGQALQRLVNRDDLWTVGHNSRFDAKFVDVRLGVRWDPLFDTMLASYTLDEYPGGHDLKQLLRVHRNMPDYAAAISEEFRQSRAESIDPDALHLYLAYDCDGTRWLAKLFHNSLKRSGMLSFYERCLRPADRLIRSMELRGAHLDLPYFREQEHEFRHIAESHLAALKAIAAKHAMPDFNPGSPKQVATLVYDRLKLQKKTLEELEGSMDGAGASAGGRLSGGESGWAGEERSTDKLTLPTLSDPTGAVEHLIKYRFHSKIATTYFHGLAQRSVGKPPRVHPSFLLHGTVTGRLACQNPNLHNIPTIAGPIVKYGFTAPPGWVIVEADYSQLELRLAAILSNDQALLQVFRDGRDIHTEVASQDVFLIPPDQVTKPQRVYAKMIVFGTLYGRGPKSLAMPKPYGLGCTVEEAEGYLASFFDRYVNLKLAREEWMRLAIERGWLENPFGRRRRFPLVTRKHRRHTENQAVNFPPQSTANDVCMNAGVRLAEATSTDQLRIVFLVHDAIVMEVRRDCLGELAPLIKSTMQDVPLELPIPLLTDAEAGPSWGSVLGLPEPEDALQVHTPKRGWSDYKRYSDPADRVSKAYDLLHSAKPVRVVRADGDTVMNKAAKALTAA